MKLSKLSKLLLISETEPGDPIPYQDTVSPELWRGAMFAISISVVAMVVFIIPWVYGWVRIIKLIFGG